MTEQTISPPPRDPNWISLTAQQRASVRTRILRDVRAQRRIDTFNDRFVAKAPAADIDPHSSALFHATALVAASRAHGVPFDMLRERAIALIVHTLAIVEDLDLNREFANALVEYEMAQAMAAEEG